MSWYSIPDYQFSCINQDEDCEEEIEIFDFPNDDDYDSTENMFNLENNEKNKFKVFQQRYYTHFTHSNSKRHVPKKLIFKYHQKIMENFPGLVRNPVRSETRSIVYYFKAFADQADIIMDALQKLENENIINYENDKKASTSSNQK